MKIGILILIFNLSISWANADLKKINFTKTNNKATCLDLISNLQLYAKEQRELNSIVSNFIQQTGEIMTAWHSELVQLEGKQVSIPAGSFNTISETGQAVLNSSEVAAQNFKILENYLAELSIELKKCLTPAGE